jgi:23S rRNA (cytidine1920-2'-O)/16S rRNA (cytidine1409-2'-O)-methyltransferase
MRLDHLLVHRQLAASRSQAQRLVAAGVTWRWPVGVGAWRTARKAGDDVPEGAELQLADTAESRYVSRGGLKLEGALAASGVSVQGCVCLDVGQSTGGFTDCLLQHGAARVVGVDVGHGQLHERLRGDARVVCIEKTNARDGEALSNMIAATASKQGDTAQKHLKFDCIVGDVSFISLTLVLPALRPLLADDGVLLMLVKPQFELQPHDIGKGGLVRDPLLYAVVEQKLRTACKQHALQVLAWLDSPIVGGDGNREFFVLARPLPDTSNDNDEHRSGA